MKKIILFFAVLICTNFVAKAQTLLHSWNFNNSTSLTTLLAPNTVLVPGASITHNVVTNSEIPITGNTTGQGFEITNPNARNGDVAGAHLRFNNAVGGNLVFALPTTGYKDIVVKYATRRSTQGAFNQIIDYSIDGTNYVNFTTIMPLEANPVLQTLDFGTILTANNNPNFKIRISFTQGGATGTAGNNRFDNFTLEGNSLAAADVTAPSVVFTPLNNVLNANINTQPKISFNELIRLVDNSAITNANVGTLVELRLNDATGALVAFNATITGSEITLVPSLALLNNQKYYVAVKPNVIEDLSNNAITTTPSSVFTTRANQIAFASNFLSVAENAGSVTVTLTLTDPTISSANLVLKAAPFSNTSASDITYATQTLNFTATSNATQTITIPITDDLLSEMDEYFVLALENLNGVTLAGKQFLTVYIRDNDRVAPVPTQELTLNYTSSFKPNTATGSTTEIVVHDAATQRLFMTSAVQDRLDIANFSNPAAVTLIKSINMAPYGGITSVAVKNGVVAVACPNANEQLDGSVVFFNTDGDFIKQVTVGALPDMITFSPDGNKIFTANEGQPNTTYTVDPEGSVSIIDISGGIASVNQSKVTTLLLTGFNAQEATLIASGVRKTRLSSTLSQDFEPEYVTVSADNTKAWVVMQENNAIAEINLATNTYTSLWALGKKDFNVNGSGLDASDNSGRIHISNFPVKSYFMPDGIANYTANGKTYLVTANEGDEKEYGTFVERTTVGAVTLDPTIFPNGEVLKENHNLGRLRITSFNGDTDSDGDFDELIMVGARSFSIFDASTKGIVYDSKDDMELFTSKSPITSPFFNADNESSTLKNRSRSKGPEPEGVTLATIAGQVYAFVGLERVGGIMVYNITDPANVKFVDYKNNRTTNQATSDLGPEGIIYISAANSPTGKPYVMIANEISGNISVFELAGTVLTNPTVSISSPTNNAIFDAGTPITLKAVAHDENGTIKKVEFYNSGNLILTDSIAPYEFSSNGVGAGSYLVTAKAFDNSGNSTVSDTVKITVTACTPVGHITAEGYFNIPGKLVSNLTSNSNYPNNPSISTQLTSLNYQNIGDNYGGRLRGYICAPETGNYTFYIASNENSELYLSTNGEASNKRKIAYLSSDVAPRAWFTFFTQKSVQIFLLKGARYYIEVLHKESTGADHLSVGWKIPGTNTVNVISGSYLSPISNSMSTSSLAFADINSLLNQSQLNADATNKKSHTLVVYPNPVTANIINVKSSNTDLKQVNVKLFSINGALVYHGKPVVTAGNFEIKLNHKPESGVYILHVEGLGTQQLIVK